MLSKLKQVIKSEKTEIDVYREISEKQDVDESLVLLEGAQGKNYNGNMFYLLWELEKNVCWKEKKPIFVVTKETQKKTVEFLRNYNFSKVKVVVRDSKEYAEYLAKSKYLFTDNSFPTYMVKRKEQIYVNTWHGTPIKHLGISDLINATSLPNVQKNYFMCDYALFPNDHTRDVFLEDYNLKNYMSGKCLMCDYPRNDAFYRGNKKADKVEKLAYMPTWRGSGRIANIKEQEKIVKEFLNKIDQRLTNKQILYVNLHFLVGNNLDFSQYKHIQSFPKNKETYDFLKDCDLLISDYSSVIFDFAVSGKPVILYAYDREDYEEKKGTYFSLDELPFPIVKDVENLVHEINGYETRDLSRFYQKFCTYKHQNSSFKVLDLIINGNSNDLVIQDVPQNNKKNLYIYGDFLGKSLQKQALINYIKQIDFEKYNVMLGFKGKLSFQKVKFLKEDLPEKVAVHALVNKYTFSREQKVRLWIRKKFRLGIHSKKVREIFEYQKDRFLGQMKIDEFVQFVIDGEKMIETFAQLPCKKTLLLLPYAVTRVLRSINPFLFNEKMACEFYDNVVDLRNKDMRYELIKDDLELKAKETFYNQTTIYRTLLFKSWLKKDYFKAMTLFKVMTSMEINQKEVQVIVGEEIAQSSFLLKRGIPWLKNSRLNICYFKLPIKSVEEMKRNNRIRWVWKDQDGFGYEKRVNYGLKGNTYRVDHIKILRGKKRSVYYRANDQKSLILTVRPINYTDARKERIKLRIAAFLAKFVRSKAYVMLYEKDCARYEESASIVYEKLLNEGHKNICFVLDEKYYKEHLDEIPEMYRKNIIAKYSFRHYLMFFGCKTFISSESIGHALETWCYSKPVRKRLVDKNFNYIFLQHGVMYMISLNSPSRKMFSQMPKKAAKYRVVVSSELEAEHFITWGNHKSEHIYLTGLCKFDRNQWNHDADKIVIMPTWRPWEYNDAEENLTRTNYYQMLKRMIRAVPKELEDQLIVLPHPLIAEIFRKREKEFEKFLPDQNIKYDTILQDTKLLITDYSSISYDAFYRGSNVIFYWEELTQCLDAYGEGTKLMLNDQNAFGDICYNEKELSESIVQSYRADQKRDYRKNYEQIVKFHDGNNTKRLLEYLKKDGII